MDIQSTLLYKSLKSCYIAIMSAKNELAMVIIPTFKKKVDETLLYLRTPKSDRLVLNGFLFFSEDKPQCKNFGDDINYHILKQLTGKHLFNYRYLFSNFIKEANYLCIGSIIRKWGNKASIIWGSGAMRGDEKMLYKPAKVLAVRGKLTRAWLLENGIECPEIYGDPALLLPRFYKPHVEKRYKYGVIPHIYDIESDGAQQLIKELDAHIIRFDSYDDWHYVIDEICSCEYIISSSLHGLIISDSYGVPNVWVEFSDLVEGAGYKFRDYFSAVGREETSPIQITPPVWQRKSTDF